MGTKVILPRKGSPKGAGLRLGDTRVATYPDCAIFDSWRFDTLDNIFLAFQSASHANPVRRFSDPLYTLDPVASGCLPSFSRDRISLHRIGSAYQIRFDRPTQTEATAIGGEGFRQTLGVSLELVLAIFTRKSSYHPFNYPKRIVRRPSSLLLPSRIQC